MTVLRQLGAKGFRPLFLLAAAFATVAIPLWVWSMGSGPVPHGPLVGVAWHSHEMVFGYTVAVIAGFLLTAVENWTGRPTLRGTPLLGLAGIWTAARILMWGPGWWGPWLNLAVLPVVVLGIARPLWSTRNMRNLPFVVLLTGLWGANVAVFLDAAGWWPGASVVATRVAVHVIAVIILVVAGRVVPMFTRNATGDSRVRALPLLDRVAVGSALALTVLQLWPTSPVTAVVAGLAGATTVARMAGWWTLGVLSRPLLWVLHAGHAAVGGGLALQALPALGIPTGSSPLHLITVGGIGMLTIGMMARVGLGHTGRPLRAPMPMAAAFGAIGLATLTRAFGPWADPEGTMMWLWVSAALWSAGFLAFVGIYTPILGSPRADGRPG